MILLQISGAPFGVMEIIKAIFGKFSILFLIQSAIFIVFLYWALSEPIKLHARRNIGRKAFSLPAAIAGATIYLGWGIFLFMIACFALDYNIEYNDSTQITIATIFSVYFLVSAVFSGIIAFKILSRAMHEYYRAKTENSQDWHILEYRGDSLIYDDYKTYDWTKEDVWLKAEPKHYLKKAFALLILVFPFALLLFVTVLFFWINEWYHLKYKPYRQKEAFLNMRIEAEKARQHYNSGENTNEIPRVKGV